MLSLETENVSLEAVVKIYACIDTLNDEECVEFGNKTSDLEVSRSTLA